MEKKLLKSTILEFVLMIVEIIVLIAFMHICFLAIARPLDISWTATATIGFFGIFFVCKKITFRK